jgi:hypothetical protein
VWLEINESHLGPEVLPSFWSDNAMTLMPGESRLVTVQLRAGTNPPRRLMVEGFNVLPREFTFSPTEKAEPIRLDIASLAQSERAGKPILVVQLAITGEIGPRWTTWPIELMVDGRKYRTFRAALQGSKQTEVRIPLELVTGVHRIQVGDKSIDVNIAP